MQDIRWKQRFNNFLKAFQTLADAFKLAKTRELTNLEQQGLIQSFEFTHELAWNVLKDYLEFKGISGLIGSRDATRAAFKQGLIDDGEAWMRMIDIRNQTTHTYNEHTATDAVRAILDQFFPAFEQLVMVFSDRYQQKDLDS